MIWDLFISHASEDKEEIVKPLAVSLKNAGVKVWYDEFELTVGDSLSRSIDKGLIGSKNGIIVLSKAFFSKGWTEYELKSMLTKAVHNKQTILPIWHNIEKSEIEEYSLFLSDLIALSSKMPMTTLVENILLKVRPDILNSHLIQSLGRKIIKDARKENIEKKKEVFSLMLDFAGTGEFTLENNNYKHLSDSDKMNIIECYIRNLEHLKSMIDVKFG